MTGAASHQRALQGESAAANDRQTIRLLKIHSIDRVSTSITWLQLLNMYKRLFQPFQVGLQQG